MNRTVENSLAVMSKEFEQTIVDEASTTVTYIGYAEFGVATSAAKWMIKKIIATSATAPQGVITTAYATGFKNSVQIWDNRAALTYYS